MKRLNIDTMEVLNQVLVEAIPKSLDEQRYLLVGMKNGSIAEYDVAKDAKEVIMHSHHDGEVWGLCVLEDQQKFVTSADDNKILMFDVI